MKEKYLTQFIEICYEIAESNQQKLTDFGEACWLFFLKHPKLNNEENRNDLGIAFRQEFEDNHTVIIFY